MKGLTSRSTGTIDLVTAPWSSAGHMRGTVSPVNSACGAKAKLTLAERVYRWLYAGSLQTEMSTQPSTSPPRRPSPRVRVPSD